MRAAKLAQFLEKALLNFLPVLVKGKPGTGKSEIAAEVAERIGYDIVLMHPSISDPTDFKGMPALVKGEAHFLPFGELTYLINAEKPTLCCLEDIGQAAPATQAALMQLVLARQLNGKRISDKVVFLGCTNDTTHMAGVSGMIEPLKSRWKSIVELEVSHEDWCNWAIDKGLPVEIIAFIRFRPALLSEFKPTREISNSPSPRGWKAVGDWVHIGVTDIEVFTGAVGEGAATECLAFLTRWKDLPSIDAILLDPTGTPVPSGNMGALYSVATALARRADPKNFERILRYASRMPKEHEVLTVKDSLRQNKSVTSTAAFTAWAVANQEIVL